MITYILFALLIYFVQTLLPPIFRYVIRKDPQIFATLGPRDAPPETSVYGARAERALANSGEQFLLFMPLALLAIDVEPALLGAQIFVFSRVFYVPVYILGIPVLRSGIWTVGVFGLALMALSIAGQ